MEESKGKKPVIISNNEQENMKNLENEKFAKEKNFSKWRIILIIIALTFIVVLFTNMMIKEDIEVIKNSVVMIKIYDKNNNEISTGSGFCAYESNYIVTNFHVIEGAYKIKIVTDDNKEYPITNIQIFNKEEDLAILSGNFKLKPIKIGNVNSLKASENVTAIGSPKGQLNTVSTGVISNADNDYQIRITAPISPGSSGGVLLDNKNKVIGITYATYDSEDSQNINYAISVKYLNAMYNSLVNKKYSKITKSNYTNYMGNLKSFNNQSFNNKYYIVDSINTLYNMTNVKNRFEYLLEIDNSSWYNVYNSLSSSDKDKVILLFEELNTYQFNENNIADNIKEWDVMDFFINLNVLNKYEYAITAIDLTKYSNKDEIFNHINDNYPLDAAEKSLVIYLIGNYPWSDIHKDNKSDIFNYFDERYETKDLGAILEVLGYEVVYENDGTLTGYW